MNCVTDGAAALRGDAERELARRGRAAGVPPPRGRRTACAPAATGSGSRTSTETMLHRRIGLDPPGRAPADARPDPALHRDRERRRARASPRRRARRGPRRAAGVEPLARGVPGRRRGPAAQTSRSRKRHRSTEGLRPCHREPSRPRRFPEESRTPPDESNRTHCGERKQAVGGCNPQRQPRRIWRLFERGLAEAAVVPRYTNEIASARGTPSGLSQKLFKEA